MGFYLSRAPTDFRVVGPITMAEALRDGVMYVSHGPDRSEQFTLNSRTIATLGYIPRPEIAYVVFEMQQRHREDCESQRQAVPQPSYPSPQT